MFDTSLNILPSILLGAFSVVSITYIYLIPSVSVTTASYGTE
ncbi:hypothetical protein [Clostridium thailandense]